MTIDGARIRVGFSRHDKTKALLGKLGYTGGFSLVCLLAWASGSKADGDLAGMRDAEIEDRAEWPGGDGVLIRELVSAGFLVGVQGQRCIHDFQQHNPIGVMQNKAPGGKRTPLGQDRGFAEFWKLYPKKAGRLDALRAWRATTMATYPSLILSVMADVEERKRAHRGWLEGFIPNAATYLRGQRWEDEIDRSTGVSVRQQPISKTAAAYHALGDAINAARRINTMVDSGDSARVALLPAAKPRRAAGNGTDG